VIAQSPLFCKPTSKLQPIKILVGFFAVHLGIRVVDSTERSRHRLAVNRGRKKSKSCLGIGLPEQPRIVRRHGFVEPIR
jgi:hypothetical protein